jgi:hypothetical protein
MFNSRSDPWYTYMQPFRIVLLKKMIKAQQEAAKAQEAKAQEAKEEKEEKDESKEEIDKP